MRVSCTTCELGVVSVVSVQGAGGSSSGLSGHGAAKGGT